LRFAYELADSHGVVDVLAMRRSITPDVMAGWKAFRQLQPDQLKRIAEILKFGLTAVANAFGGQWEPDDFDPLNGEETKTVAHEASPNAAASMAAVGLGMPHGKRNR